MFGAMFDSLKRNATKMIPSKKTKETVTMSAETTPAVETNDVPAATETAPAPAAGKAASKKAAPKKAVKKVAGKDKKAPAKGKATKKAAKAPSAGGRARKDGLRGPQERILKALAKKDGLTRSEIALKAPVDVATCVEYVGSHDDAKRLANDKKHFPSLITLGLVKAQQHDVDGRDVVQYFITAKGKQVVAKL